MLLVSYLGELGLRAVSKVNALFGDVSEPTDVTYGLDRAYCYYCTSVLGVSLQILSHRRLANRALIACLCYYSLRAV
jgi:hypothetical protein